MLIYYKKYVIIVCAIAVALPVIVSSVYPFITGQLMASTISGLVTMFLLFAAGMLIGYKIMNGVAEKKTDELLSIYNDKCDPKAFVEAGSQLASDIVFPCGEPGAWYLGYYAQALLDIGDVDGAKKIASGLRESITAQKKDEGKCAILVNLIPLESKLSGSKSTMQLVDEGLAMVSSQTSPEAQVRKKYLESQKKIFTAEVDGNYQEEATLDESVMEAGANPMRTRVEFAYKAASAYFKLGNETAERKDLQFVVDNGNELKLVEMAKQRLTEL